MKSEKWICISRVRNNKGEIVGYILQNSVTHQELSVSPLELKNKISNNRVDVLNLKLTSDGRLVLQKSKFQDNVDKENSRFANNADLQNSLENAVDLFMTNMLKFQGMQDTSKIISLIKIDTQGDTNAFTVGVNTDLTPNADSSRFGTEIMFRYRKNIEKTRVKEKDSGNEYLASIIIQMISIKYEDGTTEMVGRAPDFKIGAFKFNMETNKLECDMNKAGTDFLEYTATQCKRLCKEKVNSSKIMKDRAMKVKDMVLKRGIQCATYGLVILACTSILTGCGESASINANASSSQVEQTESIGSTTYECDYHSLKLFTTKITFEMDGTDITISGSRYKAISDPLTMKDSDGNVLGTTEDKFHFFTNDDHTVSVDGQVEVIMSGDFNIIGKSYQLYDKDGKQIGEFTRSVMGFNGQITDMDGNVIVEYSRKALHNDYTVTIYDNDIMSDKAAMLTIASFVSDDIADKGNGAGAHSNSK